MSGPAGDSYSNLIDERGSDPEQRRTRDFGFLPIPRRLQYDPKKPFHFGLFLNVAFAVSCIFTVANLYYSQPILIQLSESFGVSYTQVSQVPTLLQAGYAVGLLLIAPLGDLVRRRQLILTLMTLSTTISIGLAITNRFEVFAVLSCIIGMSTITAQILIPLVADLAPPERRASALSIALSGLMFGILISRVLAGVIAQFTTWRAVYYVATGAQTIVLAGNYLMIPDYPPRNTNLTYGDILKTMGKFAFTEPALIQTCVISAACSASFANFWVTTTFLLGGTPYNYSTAVIGLFGAIGMVGVAASPLLGKIIDGFVPWYATLIATAGQLAMHAIQVGAGGVNIAAVVIVAIFLDLFRQSLIVSLSTTVFGIDASASARLNAVQMISIFAGSVIGTAAGTHVFLHYGWRAGAALNMGLSGVQLIAILVRGPHCSRKTWFGFQGGMGMRRKMKMVERSVKSVQGDKDVEASGEDRVVGSVERPRLTVLTVVPRPHDVPTCPPRPTRMDTR